MTLKELRRNVFISPAGLTQKNFDITIKYHGRKYKGQSENQRAYQAILNHAKPNSAEARVFRYTEKQAYELFYNQCKKQNRLK